MDTEAIFASTDRLLQAARGSHAQPGTLGRLRRVLDGAAARCVSSATFADGFKVMLNNLVAFVDRLENSTRIVDNLITHLQATCHPKGHHKGSRRCVSLAGQLAGLHGNDLFRTLMILQLPAEFFLEVALAAQSLILQDQLDLFIVLSEKIILERDFMAIHEYNFMAFMYHRKTLDKFVQEHMDLAALPTLLQFHIHRLLQQSKSSIYIVKLTSCK